MTRPGTSESQLARTDPAARRGEIPEAAWNHQRQTPLVGDLQEQPVIAESAEVCHRNHAPMIRPTAISEAMMISVAIAMMIPIMANRRCRVL